MEYCRGIEKADYDRFLEIMHEYLFGDDDFIARMYEKYPKVYGGYFIDGLMVGVCYGWPRSEQVTDDDSFTLEGIALIEPYNKCGRGSKLLAFFEEGVKELGFGRASVGSAGGYVEKYYMKNVYRPIEFKVIIEEKSTYVLKINSMDEYNRLNEKERERIIEEVGGCHSFIVFDKVL